MSVDKYVYPGTNVLKNKFNCRDSERLMQIETLSTAGNLTYLQFNPIEGNFDFKHLKDIHYFIFQDIFDWAGKVRTVDIGKNNLFCRACFIEDYAATVFDGFFSSCYEARKDRERFVKILAARYADLNALHPFREGNGRSQREFTRELCEKCGFVFDLTKTTRRTMMQASVESFNKGDNTGFETIFGKCVVPTDEYRNLEKKMSTSILIFSKDDITKKKS